MTERRPFIGPSNDFCRIFSNVARIAVEVNIKLGNNQPQSFENITDEEKDALETLKEHLISSPILALPRTTGRVIDNKDGSNRQEDAHLLQEHRYGPLKPIKHWSRSLIQARRSYSTKESDCLAVVWKLMILHAYSEGNGFTVRTDHSAWSWISNLAHATGKLAPWRLWLFEYGFDVVHRLWVKC